jgi:ribose/xylose/arabinose/galactoside ABC-type transport system permease subunit
MTTSLDRADTRVRQDTGLKGALRSFADRVKSGDLGMLPVAVGLVVISTVFTVLNPIFLVPNNLVNLLFDCATVGIISLGIVCVLLVGEIDLSVGSISGFASAMVGVMWVGQLAGSMPNSTTASACPALSPPSRASSPSSASNFTCWDQPAPSTCPSKAPWSALVKPWSCPLGCRTVWPCCPA